MTHPDVSATLSELPSRGGGLMDEKPDVLDLVGELYARVELLERSLACLVEMIDDTDGSESA